MAQQVTTQFWPVFSRRSDGQQAVNQKGIVLNNCPNAQQLDRTPNAQGQCDYYRLIERDEPKHVDWRKKLGGLMLREIGGKKFEDKWQQSILWDFPEGYRLYEHIKSKADGQAKPVKNHSGGGHDRQDAYLYGHPKGPKKRFRSPLEFFPHLLWLSTDETGDAENCTCKLCSPVQLEPEKPAPPVRQIANSPVTQIPARRPSASAIPSHPTTAPAPSQPPVPVPTPLPQPRSIDQQTDGLYGKLPVRPGEVVWFHREGGAWGLGVIIRRWIRKDESHNRSYLVQPLSHPHEAQVPQTVEDEEKLKPWLAWSAPQCTYEYLKQRPHLTYSQVDWGSLLSGRHGDGNPEVDASILAAKAIDGTYTLFERLKTTMTNTGDEERHWNGIFLGAEKIWKGEPVRIHPGTDIMVISDIIERTSKALQSGGASQTSAVYVMGDIYSYSHQSVPDPRSPPQTPSNMCLPIRMREDMRWRNETLVPRTRMIAHWGLVVSQTRLDISEVKGRWYESSILFADAFHKAVSENKGGNGVWMNARGDCNGIGKTTGIRVDDRVAAFGAAVPKGTILMEGVEPPSLSPPVQDPNKAPTHEMQGLELGVNHGEPGFALDDFMNLDGMADDHDGLGFNTQFNFQSQHYGGDP